MKQFVNNFTRECDLHLLYKNEYIHTYIVEYGVEGENEIYVFRTPGATRGEIILDSNSIVKDIQFYEDTSFTVTSTYSREVIEHTKKYIGKPMKFEIDKD